MSFLCIVCIVEWILLLGLLNIDNFGERNSLKIVAELSSVSLQNHGFLLSSTNEASLTHFEVYEEQLKEKSSLHPHKTHRK